MSLLKIANKVKGVSGWCHNHCCTDKHLHEAMPSLSRLSDPYKDDAFALKYCAKLREKHESVLGVWLFFSLFLRLAQ